MTFAALDGAGCARGAEFGFTAFGGEFFKSPPVGVLRAFSGHGCGVRAAALDFFRGPMGVCVPVFVVVERVG